MAYDIAGAIKNVFGFLKEREENADGRHYRKTIKRLRKAVDCAENYIELDEQLKAETDQEEVNKIKKDKRRYKERFRKYN